VVFQPHLSRNRADILFVNCDSAFLSAARTVDYRLRHEHGTSYENWRAAWDKGLSPQQDSLNKFMTDDRAMEVHESGSTRDVRVEDPRIPASGYSDASERLVT